MTVKKGDTRLITLTLNDAQVNIILSALALANDRDIQARTGLSTREMITARASLSRAIYFAEPTPDPIGEN